MAYIKLLFIQLRVEIKLEFNVAFAMSIHYRRHRNVAKKILSRNPSRHGGRDWQWIFFFRIRTRNSHNRRHAGEEDSHVDNVKETPVQFHRRTVGMRMHENLSATVGSCFFWLHFRADDIGPVVHGGEAAGKFSLE